MPAKRKGGSSKGPSNPTSKNSPAKQRNTAEIFHNNDEDEQEKMEEQETPQKSLKKAEPSNNRRKSRQVTFEEELPENPGPNQKQALTLNSNAINRRKSLNSLNLMQKKSSGISEEDLATMYSTTIKLSTENKINQKNTWDLNLIDHIDHILESKGENFEQFAKASVTLDASVKIYTSRVDSVHNEMFKVLNGLARNEQTKAQQKDSASQQEDSSLLDDQPRAATEPSDGLATGDKKERRKPRRYTSGQTLEKNPENLNLKSIEIAFDVDPILRKTSRGFTEAGASGLLLNALPAFNDCQLSLDSAQTWSFEVSSKNPQKPIPIDSLIETTPNAEELRICPTFANFQFNVKSATYDEEMDIVAEFSGDDENIDTIDHILFQSEDEEDNPFAIFGEHGFDDNHDPLADNPQQQEERMLEEILNTQMEDDEDDPFAHERQESKNLRAAQTEGLILPDDEFAYLNPNFLRNWTGSHWKFSSKPPKITVGAEEAKAKRKQKEPFYIDFASPNKTKFTKSTAKATTLSAHVQKQHQQSSNTLPPDTDYDPKRLFSLFHKPEWSLAALKKRVVKQVPQNNNDEDNDDWVHHFGAGVGEPAFRDEDDQGPAFEIPEGHGNVFEGTDNGPGAHSFPPEGGLDPAGEGEWPAAPQLGGEMELVDAPPQVQAIHLNYARTAKFVDVKALKDDLWNQLVLPMPSANEEPPIIADSAGPETVPQPPPPALKKGRTMDAPQQFSKLFKNVNSAHVVENKEVVSPSYAFICLLHLANEKGLDILQQGQDLQINPPNH